MLDNPWLGFEPTEQDAVHPGDRLFVDAFNSRRRSEDHRLITTARPQPWAGPIATASILILGANPGWSAGDVEAERQIASLLQRNYAGDQPLLWLDAEAAGTPGERWTRTKLKPVLNELAVADSAEDIIAASIAFVEFHAYHSTKWTTPGHPFPSQSFTFNTVRARIAEDCMVIIARAKKLWISAIPELGTHEHVYALGSPQNVQISPNNLRARGWTELSERLHSINRLWFGG